MVLIWDKPLGMLFALHHLPSLIVLIFALERNAGGKLNKAPLKEIAAREWRLRQEQHVRARL